jgi:hypothetical protein
MKTLLTAMLLCVCFVSADAQTYDRNTVKGWFETGDKPTQAQYWNLFNSIYFKNDDNVLTHLPFNGDSTFYLGGDSALHKLSVTITGGDTTITDIIVDSTGQPQRLVLFGAGNNHIASNSYFNYDTTRHKLVIGNKNTSFGGNAIKLGVNGNVYFNGTAKIGAYTLPATDGSNGQVLKTNGSGALAWSADNNGGGSSFNFDSALATKTTANLTEGSNLYWTTARGDARYPQLSGSYSNPTWITSLAWSKITSTPTTLSGYGITDFNSNFDTRLAAKTTDNLTEGSTNKYYTDARARAALSLTTTGTSGAATYNSSTGVFNIPNYAGGVGGSIDSFRVYRDTMFKYSGGVRTFAFLVQRVINIKDLGATGDSAQDATPYFQRATDSCVASGGCVVYIPNGFYWLKGALNGNNQQITIPAVLPGDRTRCNITYRGESKPNFLPLALFADSTYPRTGVVIKSTITGTGFNPCIFGAVNFSYHFVNFENMTILQKAFAGTTGPTLTAIDGRNMASVSTDNVVIAIDTSLFRDTIPVRQVAGIITALAGSEEMSVIKNTMVEGMRYGVAAGEWCHLDNVHLNGNYSGLLITPNGHTVTATIVGTQWNKYNIEFMSGTTLGIAPVAGTYGLNIHQLNIEGYPTAGGPHRWFDNVATIIDTSAKASGKIWSYETVNATFVNNSTSTNFKAYPQNASFAILNSATNYFDGGTASTSINVNSTNIGNGYSISKNGVLLWAIGNELNATANKAFSIYSSKLSRNVTFIDSTGKVNLGGTAPDVDATAGLTINPSNGYVGRGVAPLAPFHIRSAFASGYGQFAIEDATASGSSSINYMSFRGADHARMGLFGYGHYAGGSDPTFYFQNEISGGFVFGDGTNNRFEISTGGTLKINTAASTNSETNPAILIRNASTGNIEQKTLSTLTSAVQALTDGATITMDCSLGYNGYVTLAGNRTLALSNVTAGKDITILITQDGTGSRTITLPATSLVPNGFGTGTSITLSTGAGKVDMIQGKLINSHYYWTVVKDFQ